MDDVRCLMEGLFQLPQRGKIHAYRKFEFDNCSRFHYRLVNGRAILFYQELTLRVRILTTSIVHPDFRGGVALIC